MMRNGNWYRVAKWCWLFFILPGFVVAQENEEAEEAPKFTLNGYVKDMVTVNKVAKDSSLVDNLIHHRLNLAWYPNKNFTAKLEIRNRIFTGDLVRVFPIYGALIDQNNDYFDLSWMPVNNQDIIIHSMIDRGFIQYSKNQWEVTLGRQRINWGMNLLWNTNDLFNSYSFFDFDYEERLGSDAIRIRKYTGVTSEIEVAVGAAKSFEEWTAGMRYQLNKFNYDMQFIAGVMNNNLALGTGWAGNIKAAGFKGEMTFLQDFETEEQGFQVSSSVDYSFASSLYLNASVFYSSFGVAAPTFFFVTTSSQLDIRSLSPYRWSTFVQAAYPIHPLVNLGLATMYFPTDASVFLNPTVTVSLFRNVDFDFISQLFFTEKQGGQYGLQSKVFYFRLKWSY